MYCSMNGVSNKLPLGIDDLPLKPARRGLVAVAWYGMVWYGMVEVCEGAPVTHTAPTRGESNTGDEHVQQLPAVGGLTRVQILA